MVSNESAQESVAGKGMGRSVSGFFLPSSPAQEGRRTRKGIGKRVEDNGLGERAAGRGAQKEARGKLCRGSDGGRKVGELMEGFSAYRRRRKACRRECEC